MDWIRKLQQPKETVRRFLGWCFLGVLIGVLGGLIGAGFHHVLHFVTHLQQGQMVKLNSIPVFVFFAEHLPP